MGEQEAEGKSGYRLCQSAVRESGMLFLEGGWRLTQAERKHIGQRPGGIEHNMELADLQHYVPPSHGGTTGIVELSPEKEEGIGIEPSEKGADDELAVRVAEECCEWPGDAGEQHGADEGPGHGAREGKVVVAGGQLLVDAGEGSAIDQDIVRGLDVEGLLDLGVGCYAEVDEYHQRDEAQ